MNAIRFRICFFHIQHFVRLRLRVRATREGNIR